MKATVLRKTMDCCFSEVYGKLKGRIEQNGFLLLYEINTQKIVSKYGVVIPELVQLLFFEPKYIDQIMQKDPLAINDIPLKIVIRDLGDGSTELNFQNPIGNLKDYDLDGEMLNELYKRIDHILDF